MKEIGKHIGSPVSWSLQLMSAIVTIYLGGKIAIFGFFIVATLAMSTTIMLVNKNSLRQMIKKVLRSEVESFSKKNPINKLNYDQRINIIKAMNGATKDVAKVLKIQPKFIRCNIFYEDENLRMRMIKELTVNMNRKEELTVTMPAGYGCTGRCFKSQKPNIAILKEDWGRDLRWGENTFEELELRKCHPDLQWVISCPILVENGGDQNLLVMNVDCLRERRKKEDLESALSELFTWAQLICIIITTGDYQIRRLE